MQTRPPLTLCSLAAYWRFWLCVSVVYELFLIFILFQVSAGPGAGLGGPEEGGEGLHAPSVSAECG